MPELPEAETIARDLDAMVRDAVVASVSVKKADVLRECDPVLLASSLVGKRVVRVWRRAKLVVLDFATGARAHAEGETAGHEPARDPHAATVHHLVIQPRFTGGLLLDDGSLPASELAYVAVTLTLGDARLLHYRDVRRLGTVSLMSPERFRQYSGDLGVEPLDLALTNTDFSALVRSSRRPIKVVLMDQRRLAGIGNIYANEALWRAGIDPSRDADTLSAEEASELLAALREVLLASIDARGTSFRDYRDARGERGTFVAQLAAYGRGGLPCLHCGRRLVATHAIDGRGTVFCATCQR
jgi:formamidopyrimidine-DNA glycosylase